MCNGTLPIVRSVLHVVQRYLSNCRKPIARCAKAPIQLSEAHCTLCKGTYPIVRSPLHVVQRHLSNCRKHIARCAKVPIQLSEAHCKLRQMSSLCSESGELKAVICFLSPLDLEEVTFLLPYTSVAECRAATSIISMGYAQAPHYVWGNRNRISSRCCPTKDKALAINIGQKVYNRLILQSHPQILLSQRSPVRLWRC